MKKLFKAVAIITVFAGLTRLAGFLFRIYLSRTIGAEGLGIYQIAFSVFLVLETFVSSGLPLVVSKLTSKYQVENNRPAQASAVCAALITGLITSITLVLVLFAAQSLVGRLFTDIRCLNILLTLLPAIVFSSVYAVLRGYLWGQKKFFLVSITEFFEQTVRIMACVILIALIYSTFDGAVAASVSLVISCAFSAALVVILFFKTGGRLKSPKGQTKTVLKSAIPITAVRIASSLLMPIIAIIMPIKLLQSGLSPEQALSQYGIALGMTFPLLYLPSTLTGSLAMALIPDISSDLASKNYNHIAKKIESSLKFSIFVAFLVIPLYIGLGEPIGVFLFNNASAGYYLAYAAWIMLPISINNIAASVLNALGLEVKGFINYIFGAVVLILCIVFLPKYIGILSLVWGMGLCMTLAAILNIRMIRKRITVKINIIKPIVLMGLITVPCALLSKWTFVSFSKIFPMALNLIVAGVLCIIMFALLCMVFGVVDMSSFKIGKHKKHASKLPV
ncbi:MAG: oligosaccharide flippase family protein [Christensenellaceae bacterium]|jgi:stage V sporulation protein B|nr:oligosaccharide flippase family protein [Christensenellaceae bacterium]